MDNLTLNHSYTRKEVHDYFVPEGKFTPNAGTWGLHGCVVIPNTDHDYVFFVTYGQSQGDHIFQEGISEDGVITWQSQPRQHLEEARVLKWINQKHRKDKIYLFVRNKKGLPYTYFGEIEYKSHDPYKEYPVWFEFSLKDWRYDENFHKDFVRRPTASFGLDEKTLTNQNVRVVKPKKQKDLSLNDYDVHVRNVITSNMHLIDAGDGYRWEFDFEFDLGDVADAVFFGPGREAKVISICTSNKDISYLKAVQSKLWRSQLCFEQMEDESSEFIQCYLIAREVNDNTREFCKRYDVNLLII